MGQHDPGYWGQYGKAFVNGANPMVGIGSIIDKNTQAMYPPPQTQTPPTPQHWSTQHGGPLFPYTPPSGPPVDFGGAILPNPDNIKPRADTDSGAQRNSAFNTDNFSGKNQLLPPRKRQQ